MGLRSALALVLADAARLHEQVEATRTGASGPVRIPSSTYPQVARLTAEAIAVYATRFPGAPLPTRVPVGTASVYDALARGEIDLTAGVPPSEHRFASAPLRDVRIVACGPGIAGDVVDLRELAQRPLALLTSDFQSRRLLDAAFEAERVAPRIVYEDVHPESLIVLARRGIAVAVVIDDALPEHVGLPIVEVRHRGRALGGRLSLLWRDETALSTSARRFRDVFIEVASRPRTPAEMPRAIRRAKTPRAPAASRPRPRRPARDR
jgi:hypothetical protein